MLEEKALCNQPLLCHESKGDNGGACTEGWLRGGTRTASHSLAKLPGCWQCLHITGPFRHEWLRWWELCKRAMLSVSLFNCSCCTFNNSLISPISDTWDELTTLWELLCTPYWISYAEGTVWLQPLAPPGKSSRSGGHQPHYLATSVSVGGKEEIQIIEVALKPNQISKLDLKETIKVNGSTMVVCCKNNKKTK